MELRGPDAVTRIQDCYGGVNGLCTRLRSSPVEGNYVFLSLFFFLTSYFHPVTIIFLFKHPDPTASSLYQPEPFAGWKSKAT